MLDLESELTALKPRRARSPWDGHEFVRDWGVFGLPFSSGHVLALRVFPERLPRGSWRVGALLRAREFAAHRLMGLGALGLSGTMPSGHRGFLMPRRMYLVEGSEAVLDGRTLGHPARLAHCPDLGGVTLPARGVLAVGEAHWEILDPEAYARTRAETDPARGQGARVEGARV